MMGSHVVGIVAVLCGVALCVSAVEPLLGQEFVSKVEKKMNDAGAGFGDPTDEDRELPEEAFRTVKLGPLGQPKEFTVGKPGVPKWMTAQPTPRVQKPDGRGGIELNPIPMCHSTPASAAKCAVCENYVMLLLLSGVPAEAVQYPELSEEMNPLGASCARFRESDTIRSVSYGPLKTTEGYKTCTKLRQELGEHNNAEMFMNAVDRLSNSVGTISTRSSSFRCYDNNAEAVAARMCADLKCCSAGLSAGCPKFAEVCDTCASQLLDWGEDDNKHTIEEHLDMCSARHDTIEQVLQTQREEAMASKNAAVAALTESQSVLDATNADIQKTEKRIETEAKISEKKELKELKTGMLKDLHSAKCSHVWASFTNWIKAWAKKELKADCRMMGLQSAENVGLFNAMKSKVHQAKVKRDPKRPWCLTLWFNHKLSRAAEASPLLSDLDAASISPCKAVQGDSKSGFEPDTGDSNKRMVEGRFCKAIVRANYQKLVQGEEPEDGLAICRAHKADSRTSYASTIQRTAMELEQLETQVGSDTAPAQQRLEKLKEQLKVASDKVLKALLEVQAHTDAFEDAKRAQVSWETEDSPVGAPEMRYAVCTSTVNYMAQQLPRLVKEAHGGKECHMNDLAPATKTGSTSSPVSLLTGFFGSASTVFAPDPNCIQVLRGLINKEFKYDNPSRKPRPTDPPLMAHALHMCEKLFDQCTNKAGSGVTMAEAWGFGRLTSLTDTADAGASSIPNRPKTEK